MLVGKGSGRRAQPRAKEGQQGRPGGPERWEGSGLVWRPQAM